MYTSTNPAGRQFGPESPAEQALLDFTRKALERAPGGAMIPYLLPKSLSSLDSGTLAELGAVALSTSFHEKLQGIIKPDDDDWNDSSDVLRQIRVAIDHASQRAIVNEVRLPLSRAFNEHDLAGLKSALEHADAALRKLLGEFVYRDPQTRGRVSYDDIRCNRVNPHALDCDCHGMISDAYEVRELLHLEFRASFFIRLLDGYPEINEARHRENVAKFGAKGAGLIALQEATRALGPFARDLQISFDVPPFTLIDVRVFHSFKQGHDIEASLRESYEWASGDALMIRSSAVHSEDGEHLGPGIYRSHLLPAGAPFETFVAAVMDVYGSVESESAREYRRQIGLEHDEQMGIIVQKYVKKGLEDITGHINTVRPHMPKVIDVMVESRHIPEFEPGNIQEIANYGLLPLPVQRESLLESLGDSGCEHSALVLRMENAGAIDSVGPGDVIDIAKAGLLLEWYFKTALQIEYVRQKYTIFMVQARPLPPAWTAASTITFPSREDYIWRGKSFGALDADLEILAADRTNHQKEGIVILDSQYMGSTVRGWLQQILPKKGAVMLLRPSESTWGGHVETLCAERGVVVITGELLDTPDAPSRQFLMSKFWAKYGEDPGYLFMELGSGPKALKPSTHMKRLRVVSDGLEARLYAD